MQNIVLEQPYRFVPPVRGRRWPTILALLIGPYLRRFYGVTSHEVRDAGKLRESLRAGHGIVLSGNHSRPCDPMAIGWLSRAAGHPFFCMASWHTFMNSRLDRFLIRRCGAYSINREGIDHASLSFTVDALTAAERPVVIFAEGAVTRNNDHVGPLLEGMAFAARAAARRRAKQSPPGRVVIHPVAFKYFFRGNLETTLLPTIERLEARLGCQPHGSQPLLERVRRLEDALLALRELEYLGAPHREPGSGHDAGDRAQRLIEHILAPLVAEWARGDRLPAGTYARVQLLRSRILPEMVASKVTAAERARRWRQLADLYNVQTLGCHPPHCLAGDPAPERIIEAVERIEEDLTDETTVHGPLHLVIQAGDAIPVPPERERGLAGDPLMAEVHARLDRMVRGIALSESGARSSSPASH